jgi:hypothetical protein
MNHKKVFFEWIFPILFFVTCVTIPYIHDLGISTIWFVVSLFALASIVIPSKNARGDIIGNSVSNHRVFSIAAALSTTGIIQYISRLESRELFLITATSNAYSYVNCICWSFLLIAFSLSDVLRERKRVSALTLLKILCKNLLLLMGCIILTITIQMQHRVG